jgi:hypothetical protein
MMLRRDKRTRDNTYTFDLNVSKYHAEMSIGLSLVQKVGMTLEGVDASYVMRSLREPK